MNTSARPCALYLYSAHINKVVYYTTPYGVLDLLVVLRLYAKHIAQFKPQTTSTSVQVKFTGINMISNNSTNSKGKKEQKKTPSNVLASL